MKYYLVAPLTKIVNSDGLLTYASELGIAVGQAILVPLRNRKEIAIVVSEVHKPEFEAKQVISILGDKIAVDSARLSLARFIADRYFCSLGEALSTVMPINLTKKRRAKHDTKMQIAPATKVPTLTPDQKKIYDDILKLGTGKPHLIYGVTGSGKTEIYMQLIDKVLKQGKDAIVLVPEIALTPQTEARFIERFGDTIAVIHSHLTEAEKAVTWQKIVDGEKRVVIGPRSALFAPLKNLGIVIIDEVHETSYKQEQTPRYQAVTVAEKLAELTSSYLVLGTATPKIEQYYAAESGRWNLHILNNRIVQTNMPEVEIIDMRNEYHARNRSIFSEKLQHEIIETLSGDKQVLLFINRRGMSTFVSCRDCGYVENCPNCEIPLTYHYSDNKMLCHHCDYTGAAPIICPKCKSMAIKFFGTGTEKVEAEIKKLTQEKYPIIRYDSDTTSSREAHTRMFAEVSKPGAKVIIGTQMVAKGWDLENINLIGIIGADSLINLPDFQAESRALALMIQVAGRAGRGEHPGKVLVQTYSPDSKIFHDLKTHNFTDFYRRELESRRELHYPPFAEITEILYNNESSEVAKSEITKLAERIIVKARENNLELEIVGPTPAYIPRLRGKYRWQLLLKLINTTPENISNLYNIFEQLNLKDFIINPEPEGF